MCLTHFILGKSKKQILSIVERATFPDVKFYIACLTDLEVDN